MLPNTDSGFPHPPHACLGSQEQGHSLMRVTLHLPDFREGVRSEHPQPPNPLQGLSEDMSAMDADVA